MTEETMIDETIQKAINILCETVDEMIPVVTALAKKEFLTAGAATLSLYNNAADLMAFDYLELSERWKATDEIDRALIKDAFAEGFKLPKGSEVLEAKIEKAFEIAMHVYGAAKASMDLSKL